MMQGPEQQSLEVRRPVAATAQLLVSGGRCHAALTAIAPFQTPAIAPPPSPPISQSPLQHAVASDVAAPQESLDCVSYGNTIICTETMLARRALRSGLRTWAAARPMFARSFADDAKKDGEKAPTGQAHVSEKFKEDWKKIAPNYDFPNFPSTYMVARPPVPATIPAKLTLNFVLPHMFEINAKLVDFVIVTATTGQMGILPGHVPTIAQLQPGILSVHDGTEAPKIYFVSSGFVFVHANSVADVVAIEAVPMDRFDNEEIKRGYAEYTQKKNSAKNDLEKAEAQVGVEVCAALMAALGVTA